MIPFMVSRLWVKARQPVLPFAVHAFVILLVIAAGYMVEPVLVVQVPIDGPCQPFFKLRGWFPAEFFLQLGRINGIPEVVPGAVGNIGDQFSLVPLSRPSRLSICLHNSFTRSMFVHSLCPPILYVSPGFPSWNIRSMALT